MDPEVNMWDIGPDVLEFAQRQARITRELVGVLETTQLKPGENYEVLTRRFNMALATFGQACGFAAKHLGGVIHLRDHAGSPRLPLNPVPAAKQRETLKFLEGTLFSDAMFKVKPELLRKLTLDRTNFGPTNQDYDLGARVLGIQRGVLNQLTDSSVARRILSSEAKAAEPKQAFRLTELYDSLQNAIWSELKGAKDISTLRRNLQREHLRIIAGQVVRPAQDLPADARALAREGLKGLQAQLKATAAKPGFGKESRAHVQDSLSLIEETLKASLQKAGV
jgi:hypothetical protein